MGTAAMVTALMMTLGPLMLPAGAASDVPARPLCSPAEIHVSEAIAAASQGWGPSTLFLGSLRFANQGPTCVLPTGRVRLRAELGEGQRHWPVGVTSSGWAASHLVLRHGAMASVSARVDAVPPKGWKSGTPCRRAIFAGVLVRGPGTHWLRYVPLRPNPDYCSAYRVTTGTGTLQLGSSPGLTAYARRPDGRGR